ncbi:MAG TPA: hypothetical protein VFJ28_10325 [Marmoricola sp.]|nr:hypothetical protein [Marmoricola sp.]
MRVRRTTWDDALLEEEGSRVFVGGLEVKVSPIATLMLDRTDTEVWTDVRDLVTPVEETYGAPPHTDTLTALRHTARELARVGIVEVEDAEEDPGS